MFYSDQHTKEWAAKKFGIPAEDVDWYHTGTSYDRIGVKSQESANKVTALCKTKRANGGMYDGMPLGGQSKITRDNGDVIWDVYC